MASRARSGRSRRRTSARTLLRNYIAALSCIALACVTPPRPGEPVPRWKDEISVCGELIHTGTRVVLWNDPRGYDAYRVEPRFPAEMTDEDRAAWKPQACYHSIRNNVSDSLRATIADQGWELDWLKDHVDQFVLHFDVCGCSRQCFKVLHDERHLSVHFLLDVDGTIYQTLDLKERAWHATEANDRSIGVEIAQIGAYESPNAPALKQWYAIDAAGPKVVFPNWMKETSILTPGFVARPARHELLSGRIGGQMLYQYDFTDEQYRALAKLTATLTRVFPKIRLDVPRNGDGSVVNRALSAREFDAFRGILGHYHVTDRKNDPGPAFDWERLLDDARAAIAKDAGADAPSPVAAARDGEMLPLTKSSPTAPATSTAAPRIDGTPAPRKPSATPRTTPKQKVPPKSSKRPAKKSRGG